MNTTIIVWGVCGLVSYLVGAIPTGYLIARARGIDIRTVGSGNIGATNVFRALGKMWGILTLAADILKGFVPVKLLPLMAAGITGPEAGVSDGLRLLCAALAIAGHNWPVYLRFKGGKGVATSLGALIAIQWHAAIAGFVAWLVIFVITRYVSLSSMVGAVVVCAVSWSRAATLGIEIPIVFTVLAVLLVLRHKGNIKRLMAGSENRIGKPEVRSQRSEVGGRKPEVGEEEKDGDKETPGTEEAVVMGAVPEQRDGE